MAEQTVPFYTRLTPEAVARLQELAAADKRTPAAMARVLLERAIEEASPNAGDSPRS